MNAADIPSSLITALLALVLNAPLCGQVWVIGDGEKIKRDAATLRFAQGFDNPVWAPGEPIRLFALRNETVAFQVVIEAEDAALTSVTVDLDTLFGPDGALVHNHSDDPTQFVGRYIERFVAHYFHVDRPSGGPWSGTLWWGSGDSGPPDGADEKALHGAQNRGPHALFDFFPNPFKSSATIGYQLEEPGKVRFSVLDLRGRELAVLRDAREPSCFRQVQWDASDYSPGMYLLRLQTADDTGQKKMLLIR